MENLTICQKCGKNPATYGDGVTWSRCSLCQFEDQKNGENIPVASPAETEVTTSTETGNGFEHQNVPGLVSIIIPLYNINYMLFHLTGNCIGSIREHTDSTKTPYEIIIVDNGSPLKPPSPQSYYADKVIQNEKNEGVTKAWNQGIRASFGEYIVLLNNDTQVYEGWLEDLLAGLPGNDLVMAHPMYSLTEPFARAVEAKAIRTGLRKLDPLDKDFSCVMFRKSLVDEIGYEGMGMFDERFFTYASDSDLFKRLETTGRKYQMMNNVPIHHIIEATGVSIEDTPNIMNRDKDEYKQKWEQLDFSVVDPSFPPVEEVKSIGASGMLVRGGETGDKIYFLKDGQRHWVTNPDVLHGLGFEFGDETVLPQTEFSAFEQGEPVTMENLNKYV